MNDDFSLEDERRYPKRRSTRTKTKKTPSATYYLGYVEDHETPEMIMKKFEELEKLEKARKTTSPTTPKTPADDISTPSATPQPKVPAAAEASQTAEKESAAQEEITTNNEAATPAPQQQQEVKNEDLLTEELQEELFRKTSNVAIQHMVTYQNTLLKNSTAPSSVLLENNEWLYDMSDEEAVEYEGEEYILGAHRSDDDEADLAFMDDDDLFGGPRKRKPRSYTRNAKSDSAAKLGFHGIMFDQQSRFVVKKRVQDIDPLEVIVIKVPDDPMPISWCKKILPLAPSIELQLECPKERTTLASGLKIPGTKVHVYHEPEPSIIKSYVKNKLTIKQGKSIQQITNSKAENKEKAEEGQEEEDEEKPAKKQKKSKSKKSEKKRKRNVIDSDDEEEEETNNFLTTSTVGEGTYIETDSILNFDFSQLDVKYEALLIDPPYDRVKPKDLAKLPLNNGSLLAKGYIFIWVDKEYIPDIIDLMKKWKFDYVDNMTWVKQELNNKYHMSPYHYISRSKDTLFLFKKEGLETRKIQIRHQRNPDVVFDFVRQDRRFKPLGPTYNMIETLLPVSFAEGKCLELWGRRNIKARKGWTKIVEQ